MFQFPGFALKTLCVQVISTWLTRLLIPIGDNNQVSGGFPHSEISGSKPIPGSPKLIAGYRVLHRLLLPRHPPNALIALDLIRKKKDRASLLRLLRPSAGPTKLLPSKHVSIPATAIAVTWLVYLTWTTPSLVLRPLHPHLGAANNAVILSERCKCSSKLRASDWTGQVSQKLSGQIGIWWSLPVGQGRQNAKNLSGSAI